MWLAGIIIKIDNDRTIKVIVNLEVLHLIATLTHMLKSDNKITSIFNPPEKMRVL
jgi:regulation of enolase protein 1 (concanavalin A-like superfamily)